MTISVSSSKRAARHTRPGLEARFPSSVFKLSEDGIPMRAAPAPLARRFQQICASILAEALADADIVQQDFAALVFVLDVPGIEQWQLAEAVGIDRNSASLMTDRLERKGLVQRRVNGSDRRARELHITAKGKLVIEGLWQKVRAANARILAPLSAPEQALFIGLLVKLIEGNCKHARPGAGRKRARSSLVKEAVESRRKSSAAV
jgi:DNA-binding MarR family transcriptional regulator